MNITIKSIPHDSQRYPTIGDWYEEGENLVILVSELGDETLEALIAVHELLEALLCLSRGIDEKDVTKFDKEFEAIRESNLHVIGDHEPGDMTSAPYHNEHVFATQIEKLLAKELEVDWEDYNTKVNTIANQDKPLESPPQPEEAGRR